MSITVRLKLSITVRLGNIVYHSPLEAVSITVHMAFVHPGRAPRFTTNLFLWQVNVTADVAE
jgi:hypothetical protein